MCLGKNGLGMRKSAVDTNVILRFLVADHAAQASRARTLFHQAELGRQTLIILPLVVAETIFVLESFYMQARVLIAEKLEVFLSQRWLDVVERDILLLACERYRHGEHFVDCYLSAYSSFEECHLITFDKKLERRHRRVK